MMEKKKNGILAKMHKRRPLYVLLLPAVVLLFLFTYIPMYGIVMAFQDFKPTAGIFGSKWVGFANFITYFESWSFGSTIRNTIVISLYSIAVCFPAPILLALVCNQMQAKRFRKFFQVSSYLPHFISTVVICGMILLFTSPSSGIFARLLSYIGVTFPNVMGKPTAFSTIYVLSELWQHLGWDSILYIAALSAVDPTLYEAATMDGASKFQKMRHIDIPMLAPTVGIMFILRMGGILGVGFEKVLLLQNSLNLPASEVISTHVYKLGMLGGQYSLSAAIGLFNTVINLAMLLIVNFIARKLTDTSLL